MMKTTQYAVCTALLAMLGSETAAGKDPAQTVKANYKKPMITAPYAFQKPTIDGVIDDAEWKCAESVNALQTSKQVSPRQTRFWMMWDVDNLYVAMRSPLRRAVPRAELQRDTSRDVERGLRRQLRNLHRRRRPQPGRATGLLSVSGEFCRCPLETSCTNRR